MKTYREGATGALMDEYERAALEYKNIIALILQDDYVRILDAETQDADCRSVQSITNHVIRAGYGYANLIRKQFNQPLDERKQTYEIPDPTIAGNEIDRMMAYTEETLKTKVNLTFDEVMKNKMKTSWGQEYDFEQLLEHAIVHILRHRRQIEKLMLHHS
jgi:uncharacterized damage-inducible protein DinB